MQGTKLIGVNRKLVKQETHRPDLRHQQSILSFRSSSLCENVCIAMPL